MQNFRLLCRWLSVVVILGFQGVTEGISYGQSAPSGTSGNSSAQSQRSGRASSSSSRRNTNTPRNRNKEEEKAPAQDRVSTGRVTPSTNTFSPDTLAPGLEIEDISENVKIDEGDEKIRDQQGTEQAPDYVESQEEGRMEVDPALLRQTRSEAASQTSAETRKNARTMALLIPPPRGQIVDRKGLPMAQNKMGYQIALKYGQFENEDKDAIIAYGRRCLADAEKIAGPTSLLDDIKKLTDEQLWNHYRYRRWLPLPLTTNLGDKTLESIKGELPKGLEFLPIYMRHYPQGGSAAHLLGYVGSKGKLPKGPINYMDPLWEIPMGRSGFEAYFDKALTGRPGVWRLMFDEQGNKILDELSIRPKQGGTVVSTLDMKWQQEAESILSKRTRRGAFVVIDIKTGEVIVLASQPSFDPNKFVPNISAKDYTELCKDPANPLVSRAFQGVYPPASTYKAVVGLAGLVNGVIGPNTYIDCPASIKIGDHVFNNWTKVPEGSITIERALARSTNPFFIQVALRMGTMPFLSLSRTLGMGQRTGLPIQDSTGLIPDEDWLRRTNRRRFYDGDTANFSIGQGVIMATPLQVAQFMAAIGDGSALPKLHLIKQIQDMDGNVVFEANREVRTALTGMESACATVRKGLYEVVNGGGGTGSRAKLSYTSICGKTGTGQWGPESEKKRVAWFAGFLPYENPRYAYAALYEGLPHESIGGGAVAAPIVKDFFEAVKDDVKLVLKADEEALKGAPELAPKEGEAGQAAPVETPAGDKKIDSLDVPVLESVDDANGYQRGSWSDDGLPAINEIDDSSDGSGISTPARREARQPRPVKVPVGDGAVLEEVRVENGNGAQNGSREPSGGADVESVNQAGGVEEDEFTGDGVRIDENTPQGAEVIED